MKRLILLTLLSCSFLYGFSQKAKLKGDKYYEDYSYEEAIVKYESLSKKDIDTNRKLAISYFKINDYENSMEYWKKVAEDSDCKPDDIYNYASILKFNEQYDEAENWMNKYHALNKKDRRGQMDTDKSGFNTLKTDKGVFIIENLSINTEQQDFGTSYLKKDKITFASSRKARVGLIKRVWNWNKLPYLDIYEGKLDSNLNITKITKFKANINKHLHDGPAAFNKAGDFMVFTQNNYKGKSKGDIVKLQLFSMKLIEDKWTKPEPFSFNSNEYSVGHASLTPNADTMYFASDMPGGYGGTDIYYITRNSDDTWSAPQNMGEVINTEGNEMFPFIHPSGLFFFASDGFPGLGGLDVFFTDLNSGIVKTPENLGAPINSSYDDFALIINDEQKSGFFSSNRKSGAGNDDIYSFRILEPLKVKKNYYIAGKAYDGEGNLLSNVTVNLLDASGNVVTAVTTNDDGSYRFNVEPGKTYKLNGTKLQYNDGNNRVNVPEDKELINSDLVLTRIPDEPTPTDITPTKSNSILLVVTDSQTGSPISADVRMTDVSTNNTNSFRTSSDGKYVVSLPNKSVNDNLNYNFSLTKSGYMPKNQSVREVIKSDGQITVYVQMQRDIILPIIYFDFDKSNIRYDASKKLDEVVAIMNQYPTMVVELSSHTDCRGSQSYNMALSSRRAKASARKILIKFFFTTLVFSFHNFYILQGCNELLHSWFLRGVL